MASPKPLVLLLLQLPPPVHGASVMNSVVARSRLLADHFELEAIDINMNQRADTLRAFSLGKAVKALGLVARLTGMLSRRRPDLVYLTLAPVGFAFYRDLAFIAVIKAFGCRRIYHLHGRGIDEAVSASGWRRTVYRWAFAGADVITLCQAASEDVRQVAEAGRISIVNNGIADPFADARARPQHAPGRSPQGAVPRILFLSNMIPEKGPVVLLEALALLKKRGLAFAADFAGAWRPPLDEAGFRALVAEKGLGGDVVVHGPAYGEKKEALMTAASIFVLPSHYRFETFPVSILEAMAARLAVVATRHGGIPEIIDDGVSGALVPPRDPAALADALARLLADPGRMRAAGAAARAAFEQRFTAGVFEQRIAEVLGGALAGGAHGDARMALDAAAQSQTTGRT